jgi:hypothetical protein
MMKLAKEFLAHVELTGLFEVFVIPVPEGTKFQFYPFKDGDFPAFLAKRFGHLGEPSDCTYHEDFRCYEVLFRGLRFQDAEQALRSLTAPGTR